MVDEKAYYSYVADHSQRQGHLGGPKVGLTRLRQAMWQIAERGGKWEKPDQGR